MKTRLRLSMLRSIDLFPLTFCVVVLASMIIDISRVRIEPVQTRVFDVVEATSLKNRIHLGEDFQVKMLIKKRRDDCQNAVARRYMSELNRGDFYKTEQVEVMVLPPGVRAINLNMKTTPFYPYDEHLVRPGLWEIVTTVTYDCPDGPGGAMVPRDVVIRTTPFTVLPPEGDKVYAYP